jgi:hypothetical protein
MGPRINVAIGDVVMSFTGHIQNGLVVFDTPVSLPDGTRVTVTPEESNEASPEKIPTILERYKDIIGIAPGLPADMAENHDHYVHGTPKK